MGIQPTSPLRNKKDLDNACKIFSKNKFDSLFSALSITDHFIWSKKKGKLFSNYNFRNRPRRQKIKEKYLENGSFYIFNKKKFLKHKRRLFGKIGVYVMFKINSFQIDDREDIEIVNTLKTHYKFHAWTKIEPSDSFLNKVNGVKGWISYLLVREQ